MNMNRAVSRLIKVSAGVFFLVHLMSCAWFLTAKFEDFAPDTWPVRIGVIDEEPGTQYLAAMYWAFQTLTTVGFGDISATTNTERTISLIWMIFGVGFYSFTIGNLSYIIANYDEKAIVL